MKILVADDDEGARLLAEAVVTSQGHECRVAASGDAAWALFADEHVDVLITDWMMPGLDGPQLARAVRAAAREEYTYIIMVTSRSARGEILAGIEAGADDYLIKPLDPFALQARLLVARRVTDLHAELAASRAELAESARTDALTRIPNRRKLDEDLPQLHARSARYGHDYSLALCDIDNFKFYNDTHGHRAGDVALQAVASTLADACREGDALFRYGGEEFVVLLPEQTQESAVAAVDRLRRAIAALVIEHAPGETSQVTLSAGVATFTPTRGVDVDTILQEADRALYRSKEEGRNRTTGSLSGVRS